MRLVEIVDVFCLSCALFVFYINSKKTCDRGWFGSSCKYKCRCTNNSCDDTGLCSGSSMCEGGWFGLACQYADLAYQTADIEVVSDGDDGSCMTSAGGNSVTLRSNSSYIFTWLRVRLNKEGVLNKLNVTFMNNLTKVHCLSLKSFELDEKTVDMFCNLTENIDEVDLVGDAVQGICSVYISGGRNLALRENTEQSSVYSELSARTDNINQSFTSDKVVDGSRVQQLYVLPGCASTTDNDNTMWVLRLSKPRTINRYVIYNRLNGAARLIGFRLDSFDSSNQSVYQYTDQLTRALPVYSLTHAPLTVQVVKLKSGMTQFILTLCEVEVYGDFICGLGKFGPECELSCNCFVSEPCMVSTGSCPSGCATGFQGEKCTSFCASGKYGKGCKNKCSNCAPPSNSNTSLCNPFNGTCLSGCLDGYIGVLCAVQCSAGKYGKDCQNECNKKCAPSTDSNTSPCDAANGTCLKGCQSGFSGSQCEIQEQITTMADGARDFSLDIIISLCFLVVLVVFLLTCLCMRRNTTQPDPERTHQTADVRETQAEEKADHRRTNKVAFADYDVASEPV